MKALIFLLALAMATSAFSAVKVDKSSASLIEYEKNAISVYQQMAPTVVNVTNLSKMRTWDFETVEVPRGAGSGFVWDEDGHIITNYHVVEGANQIIINFQSDTEGYPAKIVGVEPAKDIAVLKLLKLPKKLVPVVVGTSAPLKVGQQTIAIGNPFGLDHTMTVGIVSALGRKIDGYGGIKIQDMIQTDASINPGNSGGPLLDSDGRLIGMNTLIFSKSGSSAGVGFAVPSDTIHRIAESIIKHGKVIRPGIGIAVLPDHYKRYFGVEKGIVVKAVDPKGPAKKKGIQGMTRDQRGRPFVGDIITEVDGKEVNSLEDIYLLLEKYKVGDEVEVTYLRKGKKRKVKLGLTQI